jgi:hypothetical protein
VTSATASALVVVVSRKSSLLPCRRYSCEAELCCTSRVGPEPTASMQWLQLVATCLPRLIELTFPKWTDPATIVARSHELCCHATPFAPTVKPRQGQGPALMLLLSWPQGAVRVPGSLPAGRGRRQVAPQPTVPGRSCGSDPSPRPTRMTSSGSACLQTAQRSLNQHLYDLMVLAISRAAGRARVSSTSAPLAAGSSLRGERLAVGRVRSGEVSKAPRRAAWPVWGRSRRPTEIKRSGDRLAGWRLALHPGPRESVHFAGEGLQGVAATSSCGEVERRPRRRRP